jgi:hypothetical protein
MRTALFAVEICHRGEAVDEEFKKEHRQILLMKNNFGGVGKGYEDTAGATAIGASGDPIWYKGGPGPTTR